jgi:hypothetical protein
MTALASLLYVRTIQDRVIGDRLLAKVTREVNQDLANRLYRSAGVEQVKDALTQYLVDEMKSEAGELPDGWEASVDQPVSFLWDEYKKTTPDPIAGFIQMVDSFTEYCHFSTIRGELIAEYVGPVDGDSYQSSYERIHGLTALAA